MKKPRITLFIIAKNEAHRIASCILSARDIVSEVIVVDSFSTDKTALVYKVLVATVSPREDDVLACQKD